MHVHRRHAIPYPPSVVVVQLCRRPWLLPLWPWTLLGRRGGGEIVQAVHLFEHRCYKSLSRKTKESSSNICSLCWLASWTLSTWQWTGSGVSSSCWISWLLSLHCYATNWQDTQRASNNLLREVCLLKKKHVFNILHPIYYIGSKYRICQSATLPLRNTYCWGTHPPSQKGYSSHFKIRSLTNTEVLEWWFWTLLLYL